MNKVKRWRSDCDGTMRDIDTGIMIDCDAEDTFVHVADYDQLQRRCEEMRSTLSDIALSLEAVGAKALAEKARKALGDAS